MNYFYVLTVQKQTSGPGPALHTQWGQVTAAAGYSRQRALENLLQQMGATDAAVLFFALEPETL